MEEQEQEKILHESYISSASRAEGSTSSAQKEEQENDKSMKKKIKKKQPLVKIRLGDGSVALHLDAKRRTWGSE